MSESRHLRSVSDLYAADEIEVLLLEEIRDLEPPPAAYSRPEDIQDFEIAGSRTGGRVSSQSSELDSPGIHSTVHSWDSHANYHENNGHGEHGSSANTMSWPRTSHLIFYCDIQGHLKTATGLVRLLLLLSSAACLATLCSSGTTKVSLFMLPLVGRLRFMIFVAVFCLLITALLLFLDISHVVFFFPFNWARVNAWIFTSVGISYVMSSVLLVLAIFEYHGGGWVPRRTRSQLTATAALGLSCALLSFILSWLHGRGGSTCYSSQEEDDQTQQLYKPVETSALKHATLKDGVRLKQPLSWSGKNSRKLHRSSINNENSASCNRQSDRKDHWASARDHLLNASQFDEEMDNPHTTADISPIISSTAFTKEITKDSDRRRLHQRRQQSEKRESGTTIIDDGTSINIVSLTASHNKTSSSTDENKKKIQHGASKKLPIQHQAMTSRTGVSRVGGAVSSGVSKDGMSLSKKPMRTSVTRSEIQEFWMQGYEHVQRTDKTTANIEQWQSAAMKSLEEKKAKDARWAEIWQQQKDHQQKERNHQFKSPTLEQEPKDYHLNKSSNIQQYQPLVLSSPETVNENVNTDIIPCSSNTFQPF